MRARASTGRATASQRLDRERESLSAVIDAIASGPELPPLLSRILRHACKLAGADRGTIGLVDHARDTVTTHASYRMPQRELGTELPCGVGLAGEVLRTQKPVRTARYGTLPDPTLPRLSEDVVMGVPIWSGERLVGVFGLGRAPTRMAKARTRARPFTDRDVALVEEFAGLAAIAVRNAEQFALERKRGERLALVARVGHLIAANLRLDDLLQEAADALHDLLGYENVAIALVDAKNPEMLVLGTFGGAYKQAIGGRHLLPIGRGLIGAAARTGKTVLVNDVTADERYVPTPNGVQAHCELVVPIVLGPRVLGVVNVESVHPFAADDADALRVVADQLTVAVENARLYETVEHAAALEERHRLARELHDSVTQQLFTAMLVTQSLGAAYARDPEEGDQRAGMLLGLTRAALSEMRALLAELGAPAGALAVTGEHPADAGLALARRSGLLGALRAQATTVGLTGLRVTVDEDGYIPQPAVREAALYRIATEALHNAVKHARATQVHIQVVARDGQLSLGVRDDGVGFDPLTIPARRGHQADRLGLASMRERARDAGGALRVESAPGRGTLVEVSMSLAVEALA